MKNNRNVKVYIQICNKCNYDWMTKKEDFKCPKCGSMFLDFEKLF